MNKTFDEYVHTCPHCKGKLNAWFFGNFKGNFLNKKLNIFRPRYFCTKECYEDYKKDFVVETYNGKPVYCVEFDGENRYMPYFEASYYFTNIDDCKKRMDLKCVSVVDLTKVNIKTILVELPEYIGTLTMLNGWLILV